MKRCKNLIVEQKIIYTKKGSPILFTATFWTEDKEKYKLTISNKGEVKIWEVKDVSRKIRRTKSKK